MRKVIHLEMLIVGLLIAFFSGKRVGQVTAKEEMMAFVQASVNDRVYGSGTENILDYVEGETQTEIKTDTKTEIIEERTQEKDAFRLALLWEEHPELLLVNKEHKLPDDYEVKLKKLPDGTNRADELAYEALTEMLKAGRKEGLAFEICSSYRSAKRQQELLDEDINALLKKGYTYKEAYAEVTKETMPPGYSEHATGLAFDIVALDYQMLDDHQEKTEESKWLRKHCAEYGFILRYPQDKEDITQINYESWHFRYVGEEAAEYIMGKEMTLEEYLEEYLNGELDILK